MFDVPCNKLARTFGSILYGYGRNRFVQFRAILLWSHRYWPFQNFELKEPSYIGGAPYDFAITNITLKDESYSTESFVINESTGAITIQNTENLSTGLYKISVSCYSNGKYYEFKDIVQVNILLADP